MEKLNMSDRQKLDRLSKHISQIEDRRNDRVTLRRFLARLGFSATLR
ncbi:MAG: hypothetical protein AAF198_05680 [Pseudomonadota bacterium]